MKKSIKVIAFLIVSLPLLVGFYACSDDDKYYALPPAYWAAVELNENGLAESFVLDDGTTLYVKSTSTSYKPKYERVAISFDVLEDKKEGYDKVVHLIGYQGDVLTKPIVYIPEDDIKLQDSIGYNKIKIFSVWVAGDFINFKFGYNTSNGGRHFINLVTDVESFEYVGDEPIELEFRHKVEKGEELFASGGSYVSFKLEDYIKANAGKRDNLTFIIKWEEYSGEVKTKTIKVDLPTDTEEPTEPETPEE